MSLAGRAQRLLDAVVDTFDAAGIALPQRRYLAAGATAHDCEQVTVALQQTYLGLPGDQEQQPLTCPGPASVAFLVEIVRKIPSPTQRGAPPADQLHEIGLAQMDDAETLLEAAHSLSTDFGGVIADVTPGEPGGAYQAITANVVLAVF